MLCEILLSWFFFGGGGGEELLVFFFFFFFFGYVKMYNATLQYVDFWEISVFDNISL